MRDDRVVDAWRIGWTLGGDVVSDERRELGMGSLMAPMMSPGRLWQPISHEEVFYG